MGKGGRRSTSWKRGQSGNRSGRPRRPATIEAQRIISDAREAAREHTAKAIASLVRVIDDPKAPHAAVVSAANSILDRGWGRPKQTIEAEAKNGTMSFLDLVLASYSPEVETRARERMLLEGHAIPEPPGLADVDRS